MTESETEAEVTLLTDMEIDEISLVTRPANQLAQVTIWKSDTGVDMSDEVTETDAPAAEVSDEVYEYIESLETKVKELTSKLDQAEAALVEKNDPVEEVLKGADSAVVEMVKGLQSKLEQAETIVKAERDHRMERDWISKADAAYGNLPVEAAALGPVLKAAADALSAEQVAVLDQALSAANEAMGQLTKEAGTSAAGPEATPMDDITKAARELMAQDESLSESAAMVKALEQRPDLYDAYRRGA